MDKVRVIFAVAIIVAFALFAAFLVSNADTRDQSEWERWVFVFGAIEAIAFAAVGWVFGREVNRQRAEKAEQKAEQATADASNTRATGAKLAGLVIGGSGGEQGRRRLEEMGAGGTGAVGGGGGLIEAVEFARRHYPDVQTAE